MILALTFHENIPSIRFFAKNTKYTTAQLVEHLPEAIKKNMNRKIWSKDALGLKKLAVYNYKVKKYSNVKNKIDSITK